MKFVKMLIGAALSASLGVAGAQAADLAKGKIVFDKCMQRHRIGVGATNFYGPVLNGPIDRAAGAVPGYKYFEAMEKSGLVWNYDTLSK